MDASRYIGVWLMFVNIKAAEGYDFNELIDDEDKDVEDFIGAWANVLIKANSIEEALPIAKKGFEELNFEIEFIDKIENLASLVEHEELEANVVEEANWLLKSGYKFKISDRLFPYSTMEDEDE